MMSTELTREPATVITVCPAGPLLVRGEVSLQDSDGNDIPLRRSTIALCRCGKTSITPFCDGTHKLIRRPAPKGNR
jgi:CDGSH-type Zn-finger protein